jgi:hypothetical protein
MSMKRVMVFLFGCIVSMAATAQIKPNSMPIASHFEIKVKDYKVTKAVSVYDLIRNIAFVDQLNNAKDDDFIYHPLVFVNDVAYKVDSLKTIGIDKIHKLEFKQGLEIQAIYGASGYYGIVYLRTKD